MYYDYLIFQKISDKKLQNQLFKMMYAVVFKVMLSFVGCHVVRKKPLKGPKPSK